MGDEVRNPTWKSCQGSWICG